MLFDSITNKIREKFTAQDNEAQDDEAQDDEVYKYNLRVIGLTCLVWGCLLYLVDSTPVGKVFTYLPYFEKNDEDGTLDLGIGGEGKLNKLPSILSVLIIFIGLVLVLHAHAGLKAQATMIVCPILYTLAFLFLVAIFQQDSSEAGKKKKKWCGGLFAVFLLTGIIVQATHRDTFEDDDNTPPPPSSTATQ